MSVSITRTELAAKLAENTALASTKQEARKAVDAVLDTLAVALSSGESLNLAGIGTFGIKHKAARTGRNPKTGEALQIGAKAVLEFKPAKAIRDEVQKLAK